MKVGNIEVFGVIYKIENLVNHKVYIGQTTRGFKERYFNCGEGIERVYNYHKYQKTHNHNYNDHLLKSIEKYGFENFEVDEVFDMAFSREELNKLEYMYIKIFNLTDSKYGYNNKDGGDNYKKSEATIIKQRIINCTPIYCITDKIAFETENEAIEHYGLNSKNIILSAIRDKRKLIINNTELEFEKCDYFNSKHSKKGVICLNDRRLFGTLEEARKYYKISSSSIITKKCNGNFKSVNNKLFFMYINDYYDKLKNITSEENKKYIFDKFNESLNSEYNILNKKYRKELFLKDISIEKEIVEMCKIYDCSYIKNYINEKYNISFHISEKDILNIKRKFNIRKKNKKR